MNSIALILVAVLNSLWQAALVAGLVWLAPQAVGTDQNQRERGDPLSVIWWA